jgi:hypothetical protein
MEMVWLYAVNCFAVRERAPVIHCIGGWVSPGACLKAVEKHVLPLPGIETHFPVRRARSSSLCRLRCRNCIRTDHKEMGVSGFGLFSVGSVWVQRLASVKLILNRLSYSEIIRKCVGEC